MDQSAMTVRLVLGRADSLPAMSDGDVVELDRAAVDLVEVYAGERLVARGEAVMVKGCWGVRVRELGGTG